MLEYYEENPLTEKPESTGTSQAPSSNTRTGTEQSFKQTEKYF